MKYEELLFNFSVDSSLRRCSKGNLYIVGDINTMSTPLPGGNPKQISVTDAKGIKVRRCKLNL